MAWTYLLLAGLFEVAWPIGLKLSQSEDTRTFGIILAVVGLGISGRFPWLAQKAIPLGTSYAVWIGIGAAGTFLVGIVFFGDASSLGRYLGVLLIIAGVATLKLTH